MMVVVSGAAGFLGLHLVRALAGDCDVCALYHRHAPTLPGVQWYQVDLATGAGLEALPGRADVIIHLAQSARYREFPEAAEDIFAVNLGGTMSMLEYARRSGVRHFLMASTGSVYAPSSDPVDEDAKVAPTSFYAATKAAAEDLARPYDEHFDLAILRLFYPYGPGQRSRLVSDLVSRVATGRPVMLEGTADGLVFNATFVHDIVDLIQRAVAIRSTGTFNLANPCAVSIREVATVIGELVGVEPVFERIADVMPVALRPRLDAFERQFGAYSFTPITDGLRAVVDEYGPTYSPR